MSQELWTNPHLEESEFTLNNHPPGCMWGFLHRFQHNRWHNVVKRLPRKRLTGCGKHSSDQQRGRNALDDAEAHKNIHPFSSNNSEVGTKAIVSSPAHKSSMKSKIKALVKAEMYRRGRHRKSSSPPYPTRKPLALEPPPENNSGYNLDVSHGPSEGSTTPKTGEDTMLKVKYLKQDEINMLGKLPVRDHTVVHGDSIYAVEPRKCDSIQESKLFMDALDLLDVRQEVFLKILQDPSSSLAQQLNFRRKPNLGSELTKSVSFPARERTEVKPDAKEEDENSGSGDVSRKIVPSDIAMKNITTKKSENKVVITRFKNIKEKLKHVIRDKKKEKNRIVKDAVHDRIPCDRSVPKNKGQMGSDFGAKHFKRTSTFNDSFDRYNQLLDISLNREEKAHVSDGSTVKTEDPRTPVQKRPATLARIHSLPDIRSYSSIQIDDSTVAARSVVKNEDKPLDLGSESGVETCSVSASGGQEENLLNVREAIDESADTNAPEGVLSDDANLEHVLSSAPQTSNQGSVSEGEFRTLISKLSHFDLDALDSELEQPLLGPTEERSSAVQQDYPSFDSCHVYAGESQIQQLYDDILQNDTKNEAEFNFVREVLKLAGFTRDVILGEWHSDEHPLDPSMMEEFECEEEYGSSDHALLFDIINEVLLDIHERSFCYWPRELTSLSRMHQLPKGSRVLEEVWVEIRRLLSWRPVAEQAIDEAVSRDLDKHDTWMNLQLDSECVGLELEDMMLDDLLDEIVYDF